MLLAPTGLLQFLPKLSKIACLTDQQGHSWYEAALRGIRQNLSFLLKGDVQKGTGLLKPGFLWGSFWAPKLRLSKLFPLTLVKGMGGAWKHRSSPQIKKLRSGALALFSDLPGASE